MVVLHTLPGLGFSAGSHDGVGARGVGHWLRPGVCRDRAEAGVWRVRTGVHRLLPCFFCAAANVAGAVGGTRKSAPGSPPGKTTDRPFGTGRFFLRGGSGVVMIRYAIPSSLHS